MKTSIDERICDLANYILENGATVRAAAARYGVSKSTVHKDVTQRLYARGGMATKQKYARMALTKEKEKP